MTKIKIVGLCIFVLSIILTLLSNYISGLNSINDNIINNISYKKSLAQEISKDIFFIYKNKTSSHKKFENSIDIFLNNSNFKDKIRNQPDKLATLSLQFYNKVQEFKNQNKTTALYSDVLLEKIVNEIYNNNLKLVIEYDNFLKSYKKEIHYDIKVYKNIQYILFSILILLLAYLFTQVRVVISFIQKFTTTSKEIIKNSTIKKLKPIEINSNATEISQASQNYNTMVENINKSIKNASVSIENSFESLDIVEKNIEDFLNLINTMENNHENINKQEDVLIQSLEELTTSTQKLKKLKEDFNNFLTESYTKP